MEKLISIIMPVFNAGMFLAPCLDSILNQTDLNWELIAINDSSTDGSLEILETYARKHEKIKVLTQKKLGIVAALRNGYSQAKGDLITRMDADDLMPKDKLKLLRKHCDPGEIATGKVKYFSDGQVGLGFQNYERWINNTMESREWYSEMYKECIIPSAGWLIERVDFESIGGFDSEMLPEDYDLCFRMLGSDLSITPVHEIIHLWRDHENRTSRNDPTYFPLAYYNIKVQNFLKIHRDTSKNLLLWGAGRKGKVIAKELLKRDIKFTWATSNEKKHGVHIYGHVVVDLEREDLTSQQTIIGISSPIDKLQIYTVLREKKLKEVEDYFWFC